MRQVLGERSIRRMHQATCFVTAEGVSVSDVSISAVVWVVQLTPYMGP